MPRKARPGDSVQNSRYRPRTCHVSSDDLIVPIVEGKAVFPQTVSWKGKGTLRIRVFDEAAKAILTEQTTDLRIGVDMPSVCFDSRGRTLVDGKRFLPIGIFGNISNRRTVNIIHDAGFNTLLPCNTVHMGLENTRGYEGHQAAMDYCQEKGMKVILCFRGVYSWSANAWMKHGVLGEFDPEKIVENIVTRLCNHPALLAYYTADEVSPVPSPCRTGACTILRPFLLLSQPCRQRFRCHRQDSPNYRKACNHLEENRIPFPF